jgi:hypothetical protein
MTNTSTVLVPAADAQTMGAAGAEAGTKPRPK